MIPQLADIAMMCTGKRLPVPVLPAHATAAEVLRLGQSLCRRALREINPSARFSSPWGEAARACLGFIDCLPERFVAAIEPLASVPPEPAKAWLEPSADPYACLCALVQEVWEHCSADGTQPERAILELSEAVGARCIYDFGSGCGAVAVTLAKRGFDVCCEEPNPVKRAFLVHRARQVGAADRILLSAPPPGSCDLVLALDVLDHVSDPPRAVEHIAGVLHTEGYLLARASFPADDWHQGPAQGQEALAVLHGAFLPLGQLDAGVSCWQRTGRADHGGRPKASTER